MSTVEFKDRVAIVTGAGGGLGRSHALELARRGVKVVVNDLGGSVDGTGGGATMADNVVAEIIAEGGEAIANGANVTNEDEVQAMVDEAIAKWGHAGMYGNFGQTNYGAAKAGLSGFMRTLCLEGAKYDIRINTLSPTARSRMTENLMPEEILEKLTVESVSAGLVYLVCDDAPNRMILCAGAGGYSETKVVETQGINLAEGDQTAENVAKHIDKIRSMDGAEEFTNGGQQGTKFLTRIQKGEFTG